MGTGTGLDGSIGFGVESAWGTAVTPTRTFEFDSESLKLDLTYLEPTGLHAGLYAKRGARSAISRKSVSGDVTMQYATLGMGMLWKQALASAITAPTLISGSAYKQIHTPGGFVGFGLTGQVGRPQPSGTITPFTFSGVKISSWEFSLSDNAIPTLKLTMDGRAETTATSLAASAYLSGSTVFNFTQATLKLGGTPTTASGETTISGGTAVSTIIKSLSLSGSNPMATDRYGLGNAGLKAEQLQNNTPTVTGKLAAEFGLTELYTPFSSGAFTSLQFDLTGAVISGGNSYLVSIILPQIRLKNASPNVTGPDILQMSTDLEAYSNEVDPQIQIKIVSTESVL